jgi:hypothetical protein
VEGRPLRHLLDEQKRLPIECAAEISLVQAAEPVAGETDVLLLGACDDSDHHFCVATACGSTTLQVVCKRRREVPGADMHA